MRLENWDTTAAVRFDQQLWNELTSLRFLDGPHGALVLGPVGVGKTHLATALGHIAVRRRVGVHMARADKLFKRLKAARVVGASGRDGCDVGAEIVRAHRLDGASQGSPHVRQRSVTRIAISQRGNPEHGLD